MDLNVLTDHFLTDTGDVLYFGLGPRETIGRGSYLYYSGKILGAVEGQNGHILADIAMEDGTTQHNGYDVTFILGDRMYLKETTLRSGDMEFGQIASSRDFYNSVLDGSYLNRRIKFFQPFKSDLYRTGAFPYNFPEDVEDIDKNVTAANELYEFNIVVQDNTDYRTVTNPSFVNMDLSKPESIDIDTLPFFFEAAVGVTQ